MNTSGEPVPGKASQLLDGIISVKSIMEQHQDLFKYWTGDQITRMEDAINEFREGTPHEEDVIDVSSTFVAEQICVTIETNETVHHHEPGSTYSSLHHKHYVSTGCIENEGDISDPWYVIHGTNVESFKGTDDFDEAFNFFKDNVLAL